jgi:hypothetical protein
VRRTDGICERSAQKQQQQHRRIFNFHRSFFVKFALLGIIILHGFNFKEFVSITFKIKMIFDVSAQVSDLECYSNIMWAGIAQSVERLATGWTVRGSNPGGGKIFRSRPYWPWGPPSLSYNGYRVFPGGKAAGSWR